MDFAPFKKDRKPDASGHYPWESPGLRARVEEERKATKPKESQGLTPTNTGWGHSADMIARDKAGVTVEARAESVVRTLTEQAAFEEWLRTECPSGDVESVQYQWVTSFAYADWSEAAQ